ncbi:hypothetical protein [Sulfitobacter sabulilitoris]|uniref:DUF2550 family protein n=1 Tax=Sulfitobacter sabulilitoris TaxID=2562655 RepID=A0A5S3PCJ1_9RHOB|nr:hypothetical protein [Sulfitobacter sabulilitoris]TMM51573.1 hypothetical protein FDT80_12490 [Sulfitobacter sabulilitoris]
MPLHILLILVIGGIAVIAGLLHLLGLSRVTPLTRDSARRAWLRAYPDDPPADILLSDDRRAALIALDRGTGLVWCFGADTVARVLTAPRVTPHRRGLSLRFADDGAPRVTLTLGHDERPVWAKRLETAA